MPLQEWRPRVAESTALRVVARVHLAAQSLQLRDQAVLLCDLPQPPLPAHLRARLASCPTRICEQHAEKKLCARAPPVLQLRFVGCLSLRPAPRQFVDAQARLESYLTQPLVVSSALLWLRQACVSLLLVRALARRS